MEDKITSIVHDFKGIGFSKIGYFQRSPQEAQRVGKLNLKLAQRRNRLEAIFESINDGLSILNSD